MKQLSRKLAAFFLTLAILLSFATVAFAHDGLDECGEEHTEALDEIAPVDMNPDEAISPQATCSHKWVDGEKYYVYHAGTYIDANQCKAVFRKFYRCTLCGAVEQENLYISGPHDVSAIDKATCTGTVQTWHMSCYNCGRKQTTVTRACPGASHVGKTCSWLPV